MWLIQKGFYLSFIAARLCISNKNSLQSWKDLLGIMKPYFRNNNVLIICSWYQIILRYVEGLHYSSRNENVDATKKMTVLLHIDWTTSEVFVISAISNGNVIIPKQQ